jgi:hypothetical protein
MRWVSGLSFLFDRGFVIALVVMAESYPGFEGQSITIEECISYTLHIYNTVYRSEAVSV